MRLNPILRKLLRESAAQKHAWDAEADFEDLVALNDLADIILGIQQNTNTILDQPVQIDQIQLWPLSLGAWLWLTGDAAAWFEDDTILGDLVTAFAMTHARTPAVLRILTTEAACRTAVEDWAKNCGVSYRRLMAAVAELFEKSQHTRSPLDRYAAATRCRTILGEIARLMPETKTVPGFEDIEKTIKAVIDSSPDAAANETDYGKIIASLALAYGQKPEYFVWEESMENLAQQLEALREDRLQNATQQASMFGQKVNIKGDPKDKADARLRRGIAALRAKAVERAKRIQEQEAKHA